MITIDRCRALLGSCGLTDAEVEKLLNDLRVLAEVALELVAAGGTLPELHLTEEQVDLLEERAAIAEHDGGLSPAEAEALAVRELDE